MPSWNDLLTELESKPDSAKVTWINDRQSQSLQEIGRLRGGRNVLFYASGFLQKPGLPGQFLAITREDLNGFMSTMYGMDWSKGLTLLLHTPGGETNATEAIVSYLMQKFDDIEVIVPTYAMSAGTMIGLASNRIVMGRQSQLGPIDPQMQIDGRFVSARAIVDQFEAAKIEVREDLVLAHVWAPVLQTIGPALLQEAKNALRYGERMVTGWLASRLFATSPDAEARASKTAAFFNAADIHMSHGRRIDRVEARANGLDIQDLEDDQDLQEQVLTAYHLATITFEKASVAKLIVSDHERRWFKSFVSPS